MGMRTVEVSDTIKRAITDGGSNFTAGVVQLYAKADEFNRRRMQRAFPIECAAYDAWFSNVDAKVPDEVMVPDVTAL